MTRRAGPVRNPARVAGGRATTKACPLCLRGSAWVDYKDLGVLRSFVSDRGKIKPRRSSGACARHQRDVTIAIKTARELALLPYAERTEVARGQRRTSPPPVVAGVEHKARVDAADEEA